MSKVPVPSRGQPLDISYISQLATAINQISGQISPSVSKYVTVDTPNSGKQSVRTAEAKILGGFVEVASTSNVNAGNEKTFSYDFSADFKFPPIVVASPINVGNTEAGRNVVVILNSPTTSKVDGVVRFNVSGDLTVGVSLIALGIPV
jgi:hypothetical protein